MGRYDALGAWLAKQSQSRVELSFSQIEAILGDPLPRSARRHQAWWANEESVDTRHVQCRSWLTEGWQASANLAAETVTFVK
jgi:hypothetical protein